MSIFNFDIEQAFCNIKLSGYCCVCLCIALFQVKILLDEENEKWFLRALKC